MERFDIFKHIAERTGGDVYIGVVGPVRTGKSTFISRFMDMVVLPNIADANERERTKDELPQSGAGRTIMTTEPKFVPGEAVEVAMANNIRASVRLVDCVGYAVPGALGYEESELPRMVRTPWFDEEISFQQAAELGTEKVIKEHSTLGLVITTDGTITDIRREDYIDAERRVIAELRELGKPFIVVLNSRTPQSERAAQLATELTEAYDVPVIPVDVLRMQPDDVGRVLGGVLKEFPVSEIAVRLPEWVVELPQTHPVREQFVASVRAAVADINRVRDVQEALAALASSPNAESAVLKLMDLGSGRVSIELTAPRALFYSVVSQIADVEIKGDADVMHIVAEFAAARRDYEHLKPALASVWATGYGVVMPGQEQITFEEPDIIRQGSRCGVRLRATAPSIHMIRADIKTEVTPLVGTEKQSEELARRLTEEFAEDPSKIWHTEFLGTPMQDLISDGIKSKLARMPSHAQQRLQDTLQKIVNEGSGGLICIIL